MAAAAGFEPALPESKSGVLPLHNAALKFWCRRRESNPYTLGVGDFKSPVSASSTTAARCLYFFALLAIAAEIVVGYSHAGGRADFKTFGVNLVTLAIYAVPAENYIYAWETVERICIHKPVLAYMKVFIPSTGMYLATGYPPPCVELHGCNNRRDLQMLR